MRPASPSMPFGAEEGISLDRSGSKSLVSYGHVALPWLLLPARSHSHCTEAVEFRPRWVTICGRAGVSPVKLSKLRNREAEGGYARIAAGLMVAPSQVPIGMNIPTVHETKLPCTLGRFLTAMSIEGLRSGDEARTGPNQQRFHIPWLPCRHSGNEPCP